MDKKENLMNSKILKINKRSVKRGVISGLILLSVLILIAISSWFKSYAEYWGLFFAVLFVIPAFFTFFFNLSNSWSGIIFFITSLPIGWVYYYSLGKKDNWIKKIFFICFALASLAFLICLVIFPNVSLVYNLPSGSNLFATKGISVFFLTLGYLVFNMLLIFNIFEKKEWILFCKEVWTFVFFILEILISLYIGIILFNIIPTNGASYLDIVLRKISIVIVGFSVFFLLQKIKPILKLNNPPSLSTKTLN
jgi:hypothetical protein